MNIFKILATGDGHIDEPHISSFLAYLLNPKKDHGINDEFLKNVIAELIKKNPESNLKNFLTMGSGAIRNLSIDSSFEIEVIPEQAFSMKEIKKDEEEMEEEEMEEEEITGVQEGDGEKKKIVDIVILFYFKEIEADEKSEKKFKKESLVKRLLSENTKGKLKQIILIENKIRDTSITKGQLEGQIDYMKNTLKKNLPNGDTLSIEDINNMSSYVFISPNSNNSVNEFNKLEKSHVGIPIVHIPWKSINDDTSILNMMQSILLKEGQGDIEAISEYTKYTLKSFVSFIKNDFKSAIQEKFDRPEYETLDEVFSRNPISFSSSKFQGFIKGVFEQFNEKIIKGSEIRTTLGKKHIVSFFYHGQKFGDITYKSKNEIFLKFRCNNFKNRESENLKISESFLKSIGLSYESNSEKKNDYYHLVFNEKSNPENLMLIMEAYFKLYKEIISKKK